SNRNRKGSKVAVEVTAREVLAAVQQKYLGERQMLPISDTYDDLRRDFRWQVPAQFNIGTAISDAWAARVPHQVCLQHFSPDGDHLSLTYGAFAAQSSSFARGLAD